MDVDVLVETVIDVPAAVVSAFVSNPENDTAWIGGIREVQMLTARPFGVGSEVRRVAAFLGRRMDYTLVVSEFTSGQKLEMKADRPFKMTITYTFRPVDGGTLTAVRVTGGGSGFYRLAAPLLRRFVRRDLTRDLTTLKLLLERKEARVAE